MKRFNPQRILDTMSITHAQALDATLNEYVKISPDRSAGQPILPGEHLVYFNHLVPESMLGSDGYDSLQAPNDFPFRRWTQGSIDFKSDLKLATPAVCTEVVENAWSTKSNTKAGVTLLRKMSIDSDVAVEERRKLFYSKQVPQLPDPVQPVYSPDHTHIVTPSRVLLFRYSALSFNGHYIHYDPEYSRKERLRDVIAQGPLMITLLLRWMASMVGPINRFEYRNHGPLFVDEMCRLCCTRVSSSEYKVWLQVDERMVFSGTVLQGTP